MSKEIEPSQAERIAFVKHARSTALAVDRLCGNLYELTQRLEEQKIIDPERPSKKIRDKKMKLNSTNIKFVEEDVNELLKQLTEKTPNDAEKIVASLFRDIKPKKISKKSAPKKAEDVKEE